MNINLVLGDPSDDGHGHTETFVISTGFTPEGIKEAYQQGVLICGVDLVEDVCCDYQDSRIWCEDLKKLMQHQWCPKIKSFEEDGDDESYYDLTREEFMRLYLFIVKLGAPEFVWTEVPAEQLSSIEIGGYGLWSQ